MLYFKSFRLWGIPVSCLLVVMCSCEKVDIEFAATDTAQDPNVTYYDNFPVDIATYKPDSFSTSGHNVIAAGYHKDTSMGIINASSYIQLAWPTTNPILNENAAFDSLELILNPNGQFYGDSLLPVSLKIYQLMKNITNANGDTYYNTSSFPYYNAGIGQKSVSLNGKANTAIKIRLSDAVGQDLFDKFHSGDDVISSSEKFIDYFRGLYITTDTALTKTAAFFSIPADSPVVRLHYHLRNVYAEPKQLDFSYTAAKQFNNISFRYTSAATAAFASGKSQLIPSSSSMGKAFLNTGFSSAVKISVSSLLALKETHPYIKVVKAILVIKPNALSWQSPYQLPASLYLYKTDDTNLPVTGITENINGTASLQTGDLVIDKIYGENTGYSYDVTQFINDKITEGEFSRSSLLLINTVGYADAGFQRLIIGPQNGGNTVQLKLYVLGL